MSSRIFLLILVLVSGCNTQKFNHSFIGSDYYYFNPENTKLKLSFNKDSTFLLQSNKPFKGSYFYDGVLDVKKYKSGHVVILYKDNFKAEVLDTFFYNSKKDRIRLNDYVLYSQYGLDDSLKTVFR